MSKKILHGCGPSTYVGNIYHKWQNQGLMGIYIKSINNQNNVVLDSLKETI